MAGPFIAAAFVESSTWRGLFWLVSPLAASCGLLCFFILPIPKNAPRIHFKAVSKQIDYLGITTGSAAIIFLLIPISGGGTYFSWESPMVISMLAVGGACGLAFLVVEHSIALLPMIPCKLCHTWFYAKSNETSLALHNCTGLHYVDTELPVRYRVLLTAVLPASLLSERTSAVTYHICCTSAAIDRRPDGIFYACRAVHLSERALRNNHLDRLHPLDPRRRPYLHLQPRKSPVHDGTRLAGSRRWCWVDFPANLGSLAGTLY